MIVLYVLVAINVLITLAIAASERQLGQLIQVEPHVLLRWGGLYVPFVRRGQYWRFASSIFLHANVQHLLLNSVALLVAGEIAGARLGDPMLVVIYLVSGVGASVVTYLARRERVVRYDESFWRVLLVPRALAVCVGASGAICGLIAAAGVDAHMHGDHETRDAMLQWLGMILAYSLVPGVDKFAHIGGALVGAAIGLVGGQPGFEMPVLAIVPVAVAVVLIQIAQSRGNGETVEGWTKLAVDARKAENTDAEIAAYRKVLELHPRNAVASYNLALAFERKGDRAAALEQAERVVAMMAGERDAVRLRDRLAGSVQP